MFMKYIWICRLQNGNHFVSASMLTSLQFIIFSLKVGPNGPVINQPALVQIPTRWRKSDQTLFEAMMA